MNERIRLLAEQAGISLSQKDFSYYWVESAEDIEKFAELIVRECANMAKSFHHHQYDFTGNLELHEFIKEHFGVEE